MNRPSENFLPNSAFPHATGDVPGVGQFIVYQDGGEFVLMGKLNAEFSQKGTAKSVAEELYDLAKFCGKPGECGWERKSEALGNLIGSIGEIFPELGVAIERVENEF